MFQKQSCCKSLAKMFELTPTMLRNVLLSQMHTMQTKMIRIMKPTFPNDAIYKTMSFS
jgi:hypothetical protein